MIAEVYIIRRMARHLSYYDYNIPTNLEVSTGDIVLVIFNGRKTLGIVKKVKKSSNIENLHSLEQKRGTFCNEKDIHRYEKIAKYHHISTSTLFHFIFTQNKVKSKNYKFHTIKKFNKKYLKLLKDSSLYQNISGSILFQILSVIRICKSAKNQVLIIIPNQQLESLLYLHLSATELTAEKLNNPDKQQDIMKAWKSGNVNILIGNKKASIIPAKSISDIIFIDCNNEDYEIIEQNPSIKIYFALKLLADQHNANIHNIGETPPLEIKERYIESISPKIVELSSQGENTSIPLISKTSLTLAENALQNNEKVLFFYNRKGHAKSLQCTGCGHIPFCGSCGHIPIVKTKELNCNNCHAEMWIPERCPNCQEKKLRQKGLGKELISDLLIEYFGKNFTNIADQIKVVSEQDFREIYYNSDNNSGYSLVIDILSDLHLQGSTYQSSMYAKHKITRTVHLANINSAKCILQTFNKKVIESLISDEFEKNELATRKTLALPPYSGILIIKNFDNDLIDKLKKIAEIELENNSLIVTYTSHIKQIEEIIFNYPKLRIKTLNPNYVYSSTTQSESGTSNQSE
jgi:primosomal protein N'